VQTGEYFNTAWLDCVHVRRDGDLGDEVRMTERTGSPGGRPVHDAFCPRGMVLRGLRGRTGASIDEAVGICSPSCVRMQADIPQALNARSVPSSPASTPTAANTWTTYGFSALNCAAATKFTSSCALGKGTAFSRGHTASIRLQGFSR
jgi:hypothetical protein